MLHLVSVYPLHTYLISVVVCDLARTYNRSGQTYKRLMKTLTDSLSTLRCAADSTNIIRSVFVHVVRKNPSPRKPYDMSVVSCMNLGIFYCNVK